MMNRKQAGFTLIELVMVIVILGILAATALPKFVNLGADARVAVMKGVEGSLRAANVMVYAKAATANQLGASGTVTINGVTINTTYGFASATGTSIAGPGLLGVMDLSPVANFNIATTNVIGHAGAQAITNCQVSYVAATATTAPTYTLNVTNCN
jgi:MSHA pilin protein MshA